MSNDFVIVPHTADLKITVYGDTLNDLFKQALIGMFQSIKPLNEACQKIDNRLVCDSLPITRAVAVSSFEWESLLVDFLSEALYLSDIHNEAYLDTRIDSLEPYHLTAALYGIAIEGFEVVEIKAVTYHDLQIEQKNGLWQTNIVFDI